MSPAKSPYVFEVSEADFGREVIDRSRQQAVVVDFWSPGCAPCRTLGPILERLVQQRNGDALLAKVNIDDAPGLSQQYQIRAIPLVIAFRDGQPILEFEGVLPEAQLNLFLDRISPNSTERLLQQASAKEASQAAEAETLYRKVMQQEPHHESARLGLARLLLAQGKEDEVTDLLSEVGVAGSQGAEAERLAGLVFLHQTAKALGDEATARRKVEANPQDAQARYELGCLVAGAGRYEEALQLLLAAAEQNMALAAEKVRPVMVRIFHVIGVRSPMADDYRNRLTTLLY